MNTTDGVDQQDFTDHIAIQKKLLDIQMGAL